MDISEFVPYSSHPGTVKVAAKTEVIRAARCAAFYLNREPVIDFFVIGAAANHRAMLIMAQLVEFVKEARESRKLDFDIAFVPLRFVTETLDPKTADKRLKDCVVWRLIRLPVTSNQRPV